VDCSVMDTLTHDVPSPYLDPAGGLDALGYDRAAVHTAAAERLARLGRWEQAYDHLRAAVRLLQGRVGPGDELDRLRREHAEAREQSRRDSLTDSYNRRYLDEHLAALLDDRTVRSSAGVSVAFVDADHFKQVNDRFGHRFGDRVLQCLVDELALDLPAGGFCARYGGEEFAVVLPEASAENALRFAEEVRRIVEREAFEFGGDRLSVTISLGVATVTEEVSVDAFIKMADDRLYKAKRTGRNRVVA